MQMKSPCGCTYEVEFSFSPINLCMRHLASALPDNNNMISETDRFRFAQTKMGTHTAYNSFTDAVEMQIIDKVWHFRPGDVVIDVGAAFGTYTLPALSDGATVIAYEPNARLVQFLRANVALNGWTERCSINAYGLGDTTKDLPYNERDLGTTGECTAMIKIRRLDEVFSGARLDMIKVDVEGMELAFLEGARQTILRHMPRLLIEVHDTADQLLKWFYELPLHMEIKKFNTGRLYFYIVFN